MSLAIREFKPGDASELSVLIAENREKINSKGQSPEALREMAARNTPEKLIEKARDRTLLVAFDGKTLVGTAGLKGGQVTGVFVKLSEHGKGIGKLLMEKVEEIANSNGRKSVFLYSSAYAVPFYGKLGFERVENSSKEYDLIYREMVLMRKTLGKAKAGV